MFNEFERAQDERMEASARRERAVKGIDEDVWQAGHSIWIVWAFRYEILANNLKGGHYDVAHQYDDKCKNVAGN